MPEIMKNTYICVEKTCNEIQLSIISSTICMHSCKLFSKECFKTFFNQVHNMGYPCVDYPINTTQHNTRRHNTG